MLYFKTFVTSFFLLLMINYCAGPNKASTMSIKNKSHLKDSQQTPTLNKTMVQDSVGNKSKIESFAKNDSLKKQFLSPISIKGRIIDASTEAPVPNAKILTYYSISHSDREGNFELKVRKAFLGCKRPIKVMKPGYVSKVEDIQIPENKDNPIVLRIKKVEVHQYYKYENMTI